MLDFLRQRGRKAVWVNFTGAVPFRLQKYLVAFFIGEPVELILYRRTITRTGRIDLTREDRRGIEIGRDYPLRFRRGVSQMAGRLFKLLARRAVGKKRYRILTLLNLALRPVNRVAIYPRRGTGLQPTNLKAEATK